MSARTWIIAFDIDQWTERHSQGLVNQLPNRPDRVNTRIIGTRVIIWVGHRLPVRLTRESIQCALRRYGGRVGTDIQVDTIDDAYFDDPDEEDYSDYSDDEEDYSDEEEDLDSAYCAPVA